MKVQKVPSEHRPRLEVVSNSSSLASTTATLGFKLRDGAALHAYGFQTSNVEGLSNLHCWRVGLFKPDPNAIRNCGDHEIVVNDVVWRAGQLSLHPGPSGEFSVLRETVAGNGEIAIVADFSSMGRYGKAVEVSVSLDDKVVWVSVSTDRLVGFASVHNGCAIDFAADVGPRATYADSTVGLKLALFRVTRGEGSPPVFERIDSDFTNLSEEEARAWLAECESPTVLTAANKPLISERWNIEVATRYVDPPHRALLESCFQTPLGDLARRLARPAEPAAQLSYALFFVPRSGSTVLSEAVSRSGVLGHPLEYFVEDISLFFLALKDLNNSAIDYFEFLQRQCVSPNGVFGFEVELERFQTLPCSTAAAIEKMPIAYLTRRDTLAQAVSMYRALNAGVWSKFDDCRAEIEFDRGKVLECLRGVCKQLNSFEDYFGTRGIEPLRLYYEDFCENPAGEIQRLAAYVGVDPALISDDMDLSKLTWSVTRTEQNTEIARRMVSEGGEVRGFALSESESSVQALLAGLELEDLPRRQEHASSLLLRGANRAEVIAAIEALIPT